MLLLNSIEYPVVQDIKQFFAIISRTLLVILNLDQFPKRYKIKIKLIVINFCCILLALDPTVSSIIFERNESEIPKCLTQCFQEKLLENPGAHFHVCKINTLPSQFI